MILELGAQQGTEKVAAIPDHPSLLLYRVMSSVEASRSSFLKDSVETSISQPLSASLTLASLPSSDSLHAKTGLVPSYQHSQIICCHKWVQKQDVPLTFNISVLGLLIHSEPVINVTKMQIRVRSLPGGSKGALLSSHLAQQDAPSSPGKYPLSFLLLLGSIRHLLQRYLCPLCYVCFPVHHRIC